MVYSRITGTGHYVPEKVLSNADLAKMVDTSDEWIVERTGIKQRHIVAEGETVASMAVEAAKHALAASGVPLHEIDAVILATCSSDKIFPSAACQVQAALGLSGFCMAFDVTAACAGFSYALSIADQYIKTGFKKHILVIGSEAMSRVVNWQDRNTCVLFGDGAGAVVLSADTKPGILVTSLHADGTQGHLLYLDNPITSSNKNAALYMDGRPIFKSAVTVLESLVEETLNKAGVDKIDWLIPHQANLRIIELIAKKLNMPLSSVILTLQEHGNTSGASIPIALDVGIRDGRIKPSQRLLLESFGGGFAWGSALIEL